ARLVGAVARAALDGRVEARVADELDVRDTPLVGQAAHVLEGALGRVAERAGEVLHHQDAHDDDEADGEQAAEAAGRGGGRVLGGCHGQKSSSSPLTISRARNRRAVARPTSTVCPSAWTNSPFSASRSFLITAPVRASSSRTSTVTSVDS